MRKMGCKQNNDYSLIFVGIKKDFYGCENRRELEKNAA